MRSNGNFLLADLGESLGGVYELDRAGHVAPILERVDGVDLPPRTSSMKTTSSASGSP